MPLLESAVQAARARFRPILMTSFAFILGMVPAGACDRRRRQRPQIDRHHRIQRMIASTCLAVLSFRRFLSWFNGSRTGSRREKTATNRCTDRLSGRTGRRLALQQVEWRHVNGRTKPGMTTLQYYNLDHALAAVFAGQQSDQRLRRVLQAVDDVFLDLSLPEATQDCRSFSASSR